MRRRSQRESLTLQKGHAGKTSNTKNAIGYSWNPFLMFLGSLETQRRALQNHAEKHHSPSCEEETTRREFDLSKRTRRENLPFWKPEMPYLLQLKSERGKTNFVGKRTTKATFVKGKQAMEILQWDERYKSFARMNRQNLQYRKHKRRRKCKPFSVTLALSWQAWQAPRPHHDKIQIRTNKDDCMDAKVWALHERYDHDTRSRAPLDSTAIYPITRSLN